MNKEYWQKPFVQRVLDSHNEKYGTDIAIKGRYEEIYPQAKVRNWDWVAADNKSGGEVAIEVKRLTDPQLQKWFSGLDKICRALSDELSGDLKGIFLLFTEVSKEEHFDLRGTNRQRIKKSLKELILREAPSLGTEKEKNLTAELRARLPGVLPQNCYFNLYKLDSGGQYLIPGVGVIRRGSSGELQGEDLVEFQRLLKERANEQLAEAKKKGISETFFVILETWLSGMEAEVIQKTLRHLNPHDFCSIEYIYHVSHNSVSCVWPE